MKTGMNKGSRNKGLEVGNGSWLPCITPLAPFGVATVQDAVTQLDRSVDEIKIGPSLKMGSGNKGLGAVNGPQS